VRSLRLVGLSLERRLARAQRRAFARRMGIEGAGAIDLRSLGLHEQERFDAVATPPVAARVALRRLKPGPEDVLLDVGSGQGHAVIAAAQLPFGRVIGVELSAELTKLAEANLQRARPRLRCPSVELVSADVLSYEIPRAVSVIYMYSPFIGETFHRFAERAFAAFDAHPRPLLIVYGFPWEHNWLIATGRVRTVDVNPTRWPRRPGWWDADQVLVTYQVIAADGGAPARRIGRGGIGHARALDYWSRPNATRFVFHRPDGGPPLSSDPTAPSPSSPPLS
jgi:SAM-dependent methyltransferase